MASLGMDGKAAKWLQLYKQKHGVGDRETFIKAVETKFGDNDYREALTELLELQQTDSLEAYIAAFEDLQYQLIMHNSGLDDLFLVTHFIRGLKPEISSMVQSQVPESLDRAMLLAKIQQQVLDKGKYKWQRGVRWSKPPSHQNKPEAKGNFAPSALWKERQVRDFRKANGLCFYCAEPFDAQHKNVCQKRPQPQNQLNAFVVNDLDVVFNDEVLNQLAVEDALSEDFCQLSRNAIAGTENGEAMKLRTLVSNKVVLILVDSGSSHSFVSQAFLDTMGIKAMPTTSKQVKLPNGNTMATDHWVPNLQWWCNGHTLRSDMKVLELGAYDDILGYDWLKAHSPMTCHWEIKTMEFEDNETLIFLKGVQPGEQQFQETKLNQIQKCTQGNDLWAVVVVEHVQTVPDQENLPEVQALLNEVKDVFQTPSELPPARFYDHQIPLIPGSTTVNSKPYRYSPQHKDEIEKQVKELVQAGFIVLVPAPLLVQCF